MAPPTQRGKVSGRWIALPLIAVVAIVLTAVWLITRSDEHRLYEWNWELESASLDGSAVDIETNDQPVRWYFSRICATGRGRTPGCTDHSSLQAHGGCGTVTAPVTYENSTVRWVGDAREIAPACVGEITGAVIAVAGSGSFDYSFDGDRLVVSAPNGSAELTFRPDDRLYWND